MRCCIDRLEHVNPHMVPNFISDGASCSSLFVHPEPLGAISERDALARDGDVSWCSCRWGRKNGKSTHNAYMRFKLRCTCMRAQRAMAAMACDMICAQGQHTTLTALLLHRAHVYNHLQKWRLEALTQHASELALMACAPGRRKCLAVRSRAFVRFGCMALLWACHECVTAWRAHSRSACMQA
jgi:hypothetical protein